MTHSTTRLVTLALLNRRPMNGYELTQNMTLSGLGRWAGDVLPGSIYHALNTMELDDFVCSDAERLAGNRVRKVYAITAHGRSELQDLVRAALARPPHDQRSDLALAAGLISLVSPEEADQLLASARAAVENGLRERMSARAGWRRVTAMTEALLDNADRIAAADLALIDQMRALVAADSGTSPRPSGPTTSSDLQAAN